MYRCPLLSAVMGTGINFFVLASLALLAWFRFFASKWYKLYDKTDSRVSSPSSSLASSDNEDDGEEDPKKLQKEKKLKLGEGKKGAKTSSSILDDAVEDIKEGVDEDDGCKSYVMAR